ncbi:HD-GYP domain-containing protein [Butyrivibrio sp. AE2032]|uniref:HD-GYP domain-containing protein n=1 Tax=Butyrivibrio sp. AE2032 TaxID=1458463 RepID=UPI00068FC9E0|nr:HD-GYP domain-containing protein [Butyrivibrio sp. AE2032]
MADKKTEKPATHKYIRGKTYERVMMLFVLLAVIAVGAGIVASITMFKKYARTYREETLTKVVRLASSEIDFNKIDEWLENGADEEYFSTKEDLQIILDNTPFLQYLYVVKVEPDGFHIVYDLTTSDAELEKYMETEPRELAIGTVFPFEKGLEYYVPALLAGEKVRVIETDDTYGWLLTKYEPIYDHLGECKGYVGADISMQGIEEYTNAFTLWVIAISIIFLGGVALIGVLVSSYARRAYEYVIATEQKDRDQKILQEVIESYAQVVDAKDPYTNGHSSRVAEYAVKIAELSGKSEEECQQIYYTALLHDVGKVGIPDSIISKPGKLTPEEYDVIKQHPEKGNLILSQIDEFSFLSVGAHYHHERYDGKGYPNGLKGEEIPEIARIIACADAYDAMTSQRSYRDPIPQHIVREEFVKGIGTQFDPEFARNMLHLIDLDTEYAMKDRVENRELRDMKQIAISYHRSMVSPGILLDANMTTLKVRVSSDNAITATAPKPAALLFDSLDGHIHIIEKDKKAMLDFEYGEIWFSGKHNVSGTRKMETKITDAEPGKNGMYTIEACRIKDHALVRISGNGKCAETVIALPDCSRFVYLGLTGEHCLMTDIDISKSPDTLPGDYIPRIAKEITFIDVPAGDVPNIQIDGYRTASTDGILIDDKLNISFHTMSLPTARLVWHCPFICIYSSDSGNVDDASYREFSLMRMDGECWEGDPDSSIELSVDKSSGFKDWETWKQFNKEGYDCSIDVVRDGNRITVTTSNGGISIKNTTILDIDVEKIYAAISGDQCAVTNIRIKKG